MEATSTNSPSSSTPQNSLFGLPQELFEAICSWLPSSRSIISLAHAYPAGRSSVAQVMTQRLSREYPEIPDVQYAKDPVGFYLRRKYVEKKLYEGKGYWRSIDILPSGVKACTIVSRRDGVSEVVLSAINMFPYIGYFELNHNSTQRGFNSIERGDEHEADLNRWLETKDPAYCDFEGFGTAMVFSQPLSDPSATKKSVEVIVRSIKQPSKKRIATIKDCTEVKLLSAYRKWVFAIGVSSQERNTVLTRILVWNVQSNQQRAFDCGAWPRLKDLPPSWKFRLNDRTPREWLQWDQATPPIFVWAWYPSRGGVWFADYRALATNNYKQVVWSLKNLPHPVNVLLQTQRGLLMAADELSSARPTRDPTFLRRVSVLPYELLTANPENPQDWKQLDWKQLGLSVQTLDKQVLPVPLDEELSDFTWFRSVPIRTSSMVTGPFSCMLSGRAGFVNASSCIDVSMQDRAAVLFMLKQNRDGTFQTVRRGLTDVKDRGDTCYQWGYWRGQPTLIRLDRSTRQVNKTLGLTRQRIPLYTQAIRVSVFEYSNSVRNAFTPLSDKCEQSTASRMSTTNSTSRFASPQLSIVRSPRNSPAQDIILRVSLLAAHCMTRRLREVGESPAPLLDRMRQMLDTELLDRLRSQRLARGLPQSRIARTPSQTGQPSGRPTAKTPSAKRRRRE